jgi:hypothetical protein
VDRAEQCPAATTVIEIHPSGSELAAALTNDLQSVADVSRDEHGCACSKERVADRLSEVTVTREEKNQWRFHAFHSIFASV